MKNKKIVVLTTTQTPYTKIVSSTDDYQVVTQTSPYTKNVVVKN